MKTAAKMQVHRVEGVLYYPFEVKFTTTDKKSHRFIHYSPGDPFVWTEVARMLDETVGIEAITPHSVQINEVAL